MIIYDKTWLANLRLQTEVKYQLDRGHITQAEFAAIANKYPSHFYTPNIFIRICLFLLTCVIISFTDGFVSLMFSQTGLITGFSWFIFLGLTTYGALELMTKNNRYYRAGVDDALLLIAFGQLLFGCTIYMEQSRHYYLLFASIALLLSVYFALRTADMLMAGIAWLSFLGALFFSWITFVPSGLATAPFIMMLASGAMYGLFTKYSTRVAYINYLNCFTVIRVVSLVAFYASGNYYVIQNLSTGMAHKTGLVPFGAIFWVWTMLLPFAYIWRGIQKKEVILLRVGLALVAAAVGTFRAYYHVLPTEVALTIAGALILSLVYVVTKYLKTPRNGFTIAVPESQNLIDQLKVESLIVAETFAHAPNAPGPAAEGVKYGGGSFGGGGSSGDF